MPRPRLLFLCQTLPYPPDGGVWIRSYHVLRLLTEEFDVTALCFKRSDARTTGHDADAAIAALRELCPAEAFEVPQARSRMRFLGDHLTSLVRGRPFTVYKHASRSFRDRLVELLATGAFDLVHVDSLDLSGYLPRLAGLRVVCVHHNIESELLRRRASVERWLWLRWYLRRQAQLLEREERYWCPRVDLNITVSESDAKLLRGLAPEAETVVIPNGVDTEHFRPGFAPTREWELVFVGGAGWFPNRDGMTWFCEEILPRVRARSGSSPARVVWVGKASEQDTSYFDRRYGVQLTGYVKDIRPLVHRAACYIVPLRVGGGTRLKILDAWAMGKAVVSTPVGCEGLDARDGENILIRGDPESFAEAVVAVVGDPELRHRLAAEARATAERKYSWEIIGAEMNRTYLGLLGSGGGMAASR